jgi:membrane protein implicated in regulation of membrane protease activity
MPILWWYWIVLGLLLIALEMTASGGFYIIFFGIAALVVGLLSLFDLAGPESVQLFLFSGLSIGSMLLFRSRLLTWLQIDPQSPVVDTLVGSIGTASEDLEPGQVGRVELRGTAWSARNDTHGTLTQGTRVRVVKVEGLMLHVKAEGAH